jgi:raffinose/stachyose/melibiose transport system substrate-binding protein
MSTPRSRFPLLGALALVLAAGAALLLAGCGGEDGDGGKPPAPGAAGTLSFWHIQTKSPTRDVVDAAVGRFRAANAGWNVEVLALENDAFKDKLRVAMAAGSPPDVFHTWGGGVLAADARAGRVLDLAGRVPAGRLAGYNRAALGFCSAEGKLLALPADVAAVLFWYNRKTFAAHGIAPPSTWAHFNAACARLKAAGVTPVALGNSDSWPGAFYFIYFALRGGGPQPFADAVARKPGGKGFEDESFVRAGELVRELADSGHLSGGCSGRNYTQMRGDFFGGKAAMMLMGNWILANACEEAPEGFVENMGCFGFPAVEGSTVEQSPVVGGVNAGYAVSAACRAPDLAVKLVLELTSEQSAREWAGTGRIPALGTERVGEFLKPETREPAAVLEKAGIIQLYYDQALDPELAQVHKSTTQGLFAGTKTPAEAARLMEEKARAIAERAGK